MSRHAKTVEAIYAAFGRGDIAGILGALREDVEWEHDAVDHGIPWLAPRQGRAQVAGFFEALRALDIRRFEPKRILADDTMAAAVAHVEIAVRATGRRSVPNTTFHCSNFILLPSSFARRRHWLALGT